MPEQRKMTYIGILRHQLRTPEELKQRWEIEVRKGGWFQPAIPESQYIPEIIRLFGNPPYEFLDNSSTAPKKLLGFHRNVILDDKYQAQRGRCPNYSSFKPQYVDEYGREYRIADYNKQDFLNAHYRRPIDLNETVDHPQPFEDLVLIAKADGSRWLAKVTSTFIKENAATGTLQFTGKPKQIGFTTSILKQPPPLMKQPLKPRPRKGKLSIIPREFPGVVKKQTIQSKL